MCTVWKIIIVIYVMVLPISVVFYHNLKGVLNNNLKPFIIFLSVWIIMPMFLVQSVISRLIKGKRK
jgi:hypothetical protein